MSNNSYELMQGNSIRKTAKLLYISSAKYGGDWHSVQHTHNCSELFYVIEGRGQFLIENQTYPVSSNDLVIVNPNVLHTEVSLNASPLKYIVLGVEGLELSASSMNENTNFCIINFKNIRDIILHYLQHMLSEIEDKPAGYEIVCQDLMEILIVLLGRQTNFSTLLTPVNKKTTRLCGTTKRYIDTHYKENITLDQLAEVCHVSKYHLAHAFTEEYGISPINYLISKRITEAEHLLITTDFSLSLISNTTGFSSPSYFAQIFKKQKGMSPTEYRKRASLGVH
ncbi:MAG: helix-turn-helix transcriptional regulator [Lachnospiraceae bacterium]|nr:helix-turn-helix transcriptional regulator [Lachnospiraceae bacterium]